MAIQNREPIVLEFRDTKKMKESNKRLRARRDNTFRIGTDKYVMPKELDGDVEAMTEWHRITKLYTDAGLTITSNADTNIIARYCTLCSLYRATLLRGATISVTLYANLLKMEDRLFLHPLAKFRNIPMIVKKDKKKEDLELLGFAGV